MQKDLFSFPALVFTAAMAFILFSGPASACTGMVMEGEDGTVVYGRTQEWSMFDFKTQATVYPEGKSFQGMTPEGKNGISWEAKYGFLSFLLLDRVTGDGMNEKGLAAGSYYHEGFAEYAEYDPSLAEKSLAPTNVVNYILSNFASIEEVRRGMQKVRVVPVKDPDIGGVAPVHFFVADPSGNSLVIEYRDGTPKIYDNPVGVITNNPTFDWHLENLRNYGYLNAESYETKTWGDMEITPMAPGSGLLGLPGDFTSPSRFVRVLVLREISNPTSGGLKTVEQFFRVMDSFNAPSKLGEGQKKPNSKGKPLPSVTQWTVAHDTTDLTTYYHTAWNRQIRKIDLSKIDFSKSEVRKIPLDEEQTQNIKDVTEGLR
jgi:choloylglycine hydrolase